MVIRDRKRIMMIIEALNSGDRCVVKYFPTYTLSIKYPDSEVGIRGNQNAFFFSGNTDGFKYCASESVEALLR
jgi:hypothetical protein